MGQRLAIVTDSTADLPPQRVRALGIQVVPLIVRIDDNSYEDGVDLPAEAFYQKLSSARALPTTSQPAVARFQALYQSLAAEEILSIHISGKLSGTLNSAQTAAQQVPDKRIRVLDSQEVSLALGYQVQRAAEVAREGAALEEAVAEVQRQLPRTGFYALLDTLQYARRSGRIGFAQALLGSMLQIKPILSLRDGAVAAEDKPRTMRRGMERLAELTLKEAPFRYLAVMHANNEPLARELARRLAEASPGEIDVVATGPVIGTHCGPGAVAIGYVSK